MADKCGAKTRAGERGRTDQIRAFFAGEALKRLKDPSDAQLHRRRTSGRKRQAIKTHASGTIRGPTADDLREMTEEEQIEAYLRSPEYLKAQKTAKPPTPPVPSPKPSRPPLPSSTLTARARYAMSSAPNAAGVVIEFAKTPFGEQEVGALIEELSSAMEQVNDGSLKQCENMLLGQAIALQSIFVHMSRRVLNQPTASRFDANLNLAMKAQNQCRMTLETLNELKNPRQVSFVRADQANVSHGHQQVNNQAGSQPSPRVAKSQSEPNKLLEETHGERLEPRTTTATKSSNPPVEAVDPVDGPEKSGG